MPQTSVFTPAQSGTDPLSAEEAKQTDGVYGSGSDEPRFVVLQGVLFERNTSDGDLVGVVDNVDPSVRFRKLEGRLDLSIQ